MFLLSNAQRHFTCSRVSFHIGSQCYGLKVWLAPFAEDLQEIEEQIDEIKI